MEVGCTVKEPPVVGSSELPPSFIYSIKPDSLGWKDGSKAYI